jgi:prepilin-type N-terminal cleavage/methylation domain-containing protein
MAPGLNESMGGNTPGRGRRGFTLVEILVAVGAVALVSVGLAAILDSVGKTVSGGRRISHFNTYAAQMELRMRRDFESMTRDGFLVIRQQWANVAGSTPQPVPLSPEDTAPRPRRVDEMLFFARGSFSGAREPLHPDVAVRSDVARIYYGHGTALRPSAASTDPYLRPEPWDINAATGIGLGEAQPGNPNVFATSWTLLRHTALLALPQGTDRAFPPRVFGLSSTNVADYARLVDKDAQVGLQPAASSVFRSLARFRPQPTSPWPVPYTLANYIRVRAGGGGGTSSSDFGTPTLASGLVDIIATDLATIRAEMLGFRLLPGELDAAEARQDPQNRFARGPGAAELARVRAWMIDALPADSAPTPGRPFGTRMRYEPEPTNYIGVVTLPESTDAQRLEKAVRMADQRMLSVSNFVPRCTEFIVEFSFGEVDATPGSPTFGQLIFYGGPLDPLNPGDLRLRHYPDPTRPGGPLPVQQPVRRNDGGIAQVDVDAGLIYGSAPRPDERLVTATFGAVDPLFNPDRSSPPNNRVTDPEDAAQTTLEWAWPKAVRITVRLADSQDPLIEETFQFVFAVPER